ncbi:MAG: glycosyltransferase [Deltaproteobacteria bacterium]|nr:glycosyltransferase [Deltaproteobacteria bacterium]
MISVIIPSYNSEDTISNCLDSLESQSYAGDFEIIVVDSSNDGTSEMVAAGYPGVKLIHLFHKTDPGTARNLGIEQATGEIIAFTDADCTVKYNWLERMAAAHESLYNVVGGVVGNSMQSNGLVGRAGYMAEFRDFLPETGKQEVRHIPTCNISYKKRIFTEFGMFQGEYYPQEDLVCNYGLRRRGEKILLDPEIQVWHQQRSGLGDFLMHQNRIGKATSRVLKKIPLEGSSIAAHPLLALCLTPFISLVKFMRTVRVFLHRQPRFIKERPMVLPVLALGLVGWAFGFVEGAHVGNCRHQKRQNNLGQNN